MKALVTGGAGFIGSHLCDRLIELGFKVVVIDNLILGKVENISHLLSNKKFQFIEEDLLNYAQLKNIFKKHETDIVFHLAANSDIQKGGRDEMVDFSSTFLTSFNILRCMRTYGVKKILFASSSAIYGDVDDEITEDYGPALPVSNYGAGKLASEAFISAFSSTHNIKTWILRFPNVVGERATHGVIYDFIAKMKDNESSLEVLGDGKQEKPYLYVADLVGAIMHILDQPNERINIYNVGNLTSTKVSTIAEMVIEEMGLLADIQYTGGSRGWVGDVPKFKYNTKKMTDSGWSPRFSSDDAVRISIQRILKN